jgi:hypothetical protein
MFRPSTTFRPLRTIAQRRLASTSAESSKQAASETVKQGAEKASQSATEAFAKAQDAWANAKVAERFAGLGKYLGPVGDRLGSLLGGMCMVYWSLYPFVFLLLELVSIYGSTFTQS